MRLGRALAGAAAALLAAAPAARAQQGAPARACGVERWRVKILSDRDAARVDTVPVATTIARLGALPIPERAYPPDARMAPHELVTWRVRAVIAQVLTEGDGDWHLVLQDPDDPRVTMIAEVPHPDCAEGSGRGATYQRVRDALRTLPRRPLVEITGVGFFDFIHDQRGRAPNAFELHPVLEVRRVAP